MTPSPEHRGRTPDDPDIDRDRNAGPRPGEAGDLPDPFALAEMVQAGLLDVVAGQPPVPIDVWRITDIDPAQPRLPDGVTPMLAVLLLGVFTRPGELVIDLTNSPELADTARAGDRRYRPVPTLVDLIDLASRTETTRRRHPSAADQTHQARLTFLRWPLPTQPTPNTNPARTDNTDNRAHDTEAVRDTVTAAQVFTACRRLAATDGCAIVAVAPTPAQLPYLEHSHLVIPAAYRAGLGYLQHIIVVTTPTHPPAAHADSHRSEAAIALLLNLLVFAPRAGRDG